MDFHTLKVIAKRIEVGIVAVENDPPVFVNNRHTKAHHAVPFYILAKETIIGQAILAQRLYHLVVVHLQPRV